MVVVVVICISVFGRVMFLIEMRLCIEKCRFILNMSSIMFILESCWVRCMLLMKFGVCGLISMFVSR